MAKRSRAPVIYIATMPALAGDIEQQKRIARHQERRPSGWRTLEAPYDLSTKIASLPDSQLFCIVDCLTVLVSNLIIGRRQEGMQGDPYLQEVPVFAELEAVLDAIDEKRKAKFVVVTNEVGWGVVPETPLGRAFRDFVGIANQKFAAQADEVWLICAGIPLRVKPQNSTPERRPASGSARAEASDL
jgi:adenosylcobinamide kinase/adenosylcobinamide-phosphate guanylyltransferase